MDVSTTVWIATLGVLAAIIVVDLLVVDARPHVFGVREATRWVIFYIALAMLFAVAVWQVWGAQYAGEFLAGYITEYSLSVDNLFVFVVIMSSFAVPAPYQHRVLLIGVLIALLLRGILIVVGAAAIERFAATFYLFGAFLVVTAIGLAKGHDENPDPGRNPVMRLAERFLPTTREYHGTALTAKVNGRRVVTPMLLVMLAIGTTDLLFALDSIPAIFGLTQEPYLVFTANAFALMGLRQLYFLLNGLLDRLVYLSYGLAAILAFIGVKLIFHAMHETGTIWPDAPEISIQVSLTVIVGILVLTTVLSLLKVRRDPDAVHTVGRAADAKKDALAAAGAELLQLQAESTAAEDAVRQATRDELPDAEVEAARARAEEARRATSQSADQLARLADEAETSELPVLRDLPPLPELSRLADRAPDAFTGTEPAPGDGGAAADQDQREGSAGGPRQV